MSVQDLGSLSLLRREYSGLFSASVAPGKIQTENKTFRKIVKEWQ